MSLNPQNQTRLFDNKEVWGFLKNIYYPKVFSVQAGVLWWNIFV